MKVDGFRRLIRQNVRGGSLFQKALLCFCIYSSVLAVKASEPKVSLRSSGEKRKTRTIPETGPPTEMVSIPMVFWWNSDLFTCVYLFSSPDIDRDTLFFSFLIRSGEKRVPIWEKNERRRILKINTPKCPWSKALSKSSLVFLYIGEPSGRKDNADNRGLWP